MREDLALTEPLLPGTATVVAGLAAAAGAVTAARGFSASGVHCGIRRNRDDLALLACDRSASVAAVFTRNQVQAAPILVCRENLAASGGRARAVIINAGNANACTGEAGLAAARRTASEVAALLGVPVAEILVASTGVIGQPLPIDLLVAALPAACTTLSRSGGAAAAGAILTTDTRCKEALRQVQTPAGIYTVGGMAKGSGMIHPDMATTLAFVTTDAGVPPALLQACLGRAVDRTFNRITVDGDTSTNDMVAVLASGASGVEVVAAGASGAEASLLPGFEQALQEVLQELAMAVVRDGEGATRLLAVQVTGAATDASALIVARTIAGSLLVKTAVHGADANWGRVVAAAGRSGVEVNAEAMSLYLGQIRILGPGLDSDFSEDEARHELLKDEVHLRLDLGSGEGSATVWTCDLSDVYVHINASYRT